MESISATQLIRNDHKVIKGLAIQIQTSEVRAPEMRTAVILEFFMQLEVHIQFKEELFYPELENYPETAALVVVSIEDQNQMKQLIKNLRRIDPAAEEFDDTLQELISSVYFNIETEEQSLLPMAEKLLGSKLEELGTRMLARKEELMKRPEYKDAQPDRVQNPNGGEQMRRPKVGEQNL